MEIWTAFLIGLLGSLHCIGMCGPIALALPYQAKSPIGTVFNVLLYNGGRITTYGLMGLLPGLIGIGLGLSGVQKNVSLSLGCVFFLGALISFGLYQSKIHVPLLYRFYQTVQNQLGRFIGSKKRSVFFAVGLLNGLLPCGLVYMALAAALVQFNMISSVLYMMFFGLGTIPLMILVALSQKIISPLRRQFIRKSAPYFMLFLAGLLIYRGIYLPIPEKIDTWFILGSIPMCD